MAATPEASGMSVTAAAGGGTAVPLPVPLAATALQEVASFVACLAEPSRVVDPAALRARELHISGQLLWPPSSSPQAERGNHSVDAGAASAPALLAAAQPRYFHEQASWARVYPRPQRSGTVAAESERAAAAEVAVHAPQSPRRSAKLTIMVQRSNELAALERELHSRHQRMAAADAVPGRRGQATTTRRVAPPWESSSLKVSGLDLEPWQWQTGSDISLVPELQWLEAMDGGGTGSSDDIFFNEASARAEMTLIEAEQVLAKQLDEDVELASWMIQEPSPQLESEPEPEPEPEQELEPEPEPELKPEPEPEPEPQPKVPKSNGAEDQVEQAEVKRLLAELETAARTDQAKLEVHLAFLDAHSPHTSFRGRRDAPRVEAARVAAEHALLTGGRQPKLVVRPNVRAEEVFDNSTEELEQLHTTAVDEQTLLSDAAQPRVVVSAPVTAEREDTDSTEELEQLHTTAVDEQTLLSDAA
eukprot:COSAG01_NODE_4223_length_5226_cov_15.609713_1_plen_474_part_10